VCGVPVLTSKGQDRGQEFHGSRPMDGRIMCVY